MMSSGLPELLVVKPCLKNKQTTDKKQSKQKYLKTRKGKLNPKYQDRGNRLKNKNNFCISPDNGEMSLSVMQEAKALSSGNLGPAWGTEAEVKLTS